MKNGVLETIIEESVEKEGFEKTIKDSLDTQKNFKVEAEKHYIELEGDKERGVYANEISYATFQLEVINVLLRHRGLYEDRKHIKTLCDEIREIADGLEKLI